MAGFGSSAAKLSSSYAALDFTFFLIENYGGGLIFLKVLTPTFSQNI